MVSKGSSTLVQNRRRGVLVPSSKAFGRLYRFNVQFVNDCTPTVEHYYALTLAEGVHGKEVLLSNACGDHVPSKERKVPLHKMTVLIRLLCRILVVDNTPPPRGIHAIECS